MAATVDEKNLRDLLGMALHLNGASELIVAKTLGYVEGIQDTKRQIEQQDAPQTEETKSE
jgi:hypothetical protein